MQGERPGQERMAGSCRAVGAIVAVFVMVAAVRVAMALTYAGPVADGEYILTAIATPGGVARYFEDHRCIKTSLHYGRPCSIRS
jgi:hypothetical protein